MNTTNQKQYLVIRNVCSNTHLRSYLEQLCRDEKVSIIEQYVDSYTWLKSEPTLYDKLDAKPSFDIVLESYNQEKLKYIEYLYSKYEKQYRYTRQFVTETMENVEFKEYLKNNLAPSYTIGEIKVGITKNNINNYIAEAFKRTYEKCGENYNIKNTDTREQVKDRINKLISGDWIVPKKQSYFQILKQKIKKYCNFETVANIAIGLNIILLVIVLTIIFNMVK